MQSHWAIKDKLALVICATLVTSCFHWTIGAQETPKEPAITERLRLRELILVNEDGVDVAVVAATEREITISPAWEGNNGGHIKLLPESSGISLERPPSDPEDTLRQSSRATCGMYPDGIVITRVDEDTNKVTGGVLLDPDVLRFAADSDLRYGKYVLALSASNGEGRISVAGPGPNYSDSIQLCAPSEYIIDHKESRLLPPAIVMSWKGEHFYTTWGEKGPRFSVTDSQANEVGAFELKKQE